MKIPQGDSGCVGWSFACSHGPGLLTNFGRVKNVFERVGVLIFFHQLKVDEPLGLGDRFGAAEPCAGRFEERRRKFVFAVGRHFFHRPHKLFF